MKNRLGIKLLQKNLLTEKKYDELRKYSSISNVRENQDASSLACVRCGGNNHASLFFWWKENLVKHKKLSKCYDHDCSLIIFTFTFLLL